MARTPQPTPGAREPSDRAGNDGPGTDLPASTPVDGSKPDAPAADGSGASPAQTVINPEPFNPNFDNKGPSDMSGAPAPGTGEKIDGVETVSVETTGEFMIQDPYTLDLVAASGTSMVRKTSFIDTAIADGRLKLA